MKYKVIGWVSFDDDFEEGEHTYSKISAVIDDIKENGYLFSGWHHQEYLYCAPLLNDGKKLTFTQRGFGDIMSRAHGYYGKYDYSLFTFDCSIKPTSLVLPKGDCDLSKIVDPTTLNETFTLELSNEQYNEVNKDNKLIIKEQPEFRYIDINDTLIIKSMQEESKYLVVDMAKERITDNTIDVRIIMTLRKI